MSQSSLQQQTYIKQGQFFLNIQPNPSIQIKAIDRTCLIMSIVIGALVCGIVLSTILALYIAKQSNTTTTTTTTITTTTTTVSTTTQTTTTVTQKRPYICSGISSNTLWKIYSTSGIFMDVDTTNCNFSATPSYFTSISGTSSHWDLSGYGAIYDPALTTFRIYGKSVSGIDSETLLNYSIISQWNVHWLGVIE